MVCTETLQLIICTRRKARVCDCSLTNKNYFMSQSLKSSGRNLKLTYLKEETDKYASPVTLALLYLIK